TNFPARQAQECPESRYIIPVVVHIIHSGWGQPDSLPAARVLTQIEQLFNDYRRRPYTKGYGSGVDAEIEFSLATKAPNGSPHSGITYTHYRDAGLASPRVNMTGSQANARTLKTNVTWPKDKYLNIWVVREICQNSDNCPEPDVLGFATLPGMSQEEQGVVVSSAYFGNTSGGQTTTHENGHYLNLYHTFQGDFAPAGCTGLSVSTCLTQGDRVCDTPPSRIPNYGNARRQNTCQEDIPILGGDAPDQVRNFMDYLSDPSLDLFTQGQVFRMHNALENASNRRTLWQSSNLQATGTGPYGRVKANFAIKGCEQPPCYVCPGQPIELVSYSWGQPFTFRWEIRQGATAVATSTNGPCATLQAPNTPGTYDVYLRVQNFVASAETTYRNFLIVRDPQQVASYPFAEGFEGGTFPPQGWIVVNPDYQLRNSVITWDRYSMPEGGGFGQSNACARLRHHRYYNKGQADYLISPPIAIPTSAQNPGVAFEVYYRAVRWSGTISGVGTSHPLLYADTLAVYVSEDCGSTWAKIYEEGGEALDVTGSAIQALNSSYPTEVFPPEGPNNQWVRKAVRLGDQYKGKTILLRIESRTGMGNNLYLDNVRVADNLQPVGSLLVPEKIHVSVAPNPAQAETFLLINGAAGNKVRCKLLTLSGQLIWGSVFTVTEDSYSMPLPIAELAAGVYIVEVEIGGRRWVQRLLR
ncbi:MAG: M43 family zinc metalloprotease, partial [Bacteroidia bacterium]|nr:M43 family zinc metalloprotease [Bacteroidia bacterium]